MPPKACRAKLAGYLEWRLPAGLGFALFRHIVLEKLVRVLLPGGTDQDDLPSVILDEIRIAVAGRGGGLGIVHGWIGPHLHALAAIGEILAAVLRRTGVLFHGFQSIMKNIEALAIRPDSAIILIVRIFHGAAVTKLIRFFQRFGIRRAGLPKEQKGKKEEGATERGTGLR